MEENQISPSPNSSDQDTSYSPGKQLVVGVSVTLFLFIVGILGYYFFTGHTTSQSANNKNVLSASTNQITPIQDLNPTPQNTNNSISNTTSSNSKNVPAQASNKVCGKNGPAQKWEYLVPYILKDGDTLQSIVTKQLNNANRVNEILQLNGQGPYVVGSTIYLPPSTITQSSGNIKEVYGMLVKKDSSYWQLSYSSDPKGLGLLIPSFWFDSVPNTDSFNVGNCITVLFDDGNRVFSVALQ